MFILHLLHLFWLFKTVKREINVTADCCVDCRGVKGRLNTGGTVHKQKVNFNAETQLTKVQRKLAQGHNKNILNLADKSM